MGSLACALASYLDAKAQQGQWLVRIEDIDPPREQPGASTLILESLQAHKLYWDGEVIFQSSRSSAYDQTLKQLKIQNLTYPCDCTRKRLAPLRGRYDGHCRHHPAGAPSALRLNLEVAQTLGLNLKQTFTDDIQGRQTEDLSEQGDFVIHRKDGLYAYQLAVVVDDIEQNITHIVRGSDLLDTTARQQALTQLLKGPQLAYSHIPVLNDSNGNKLSKQNHAPAIDNAHPADNILSALQALGFSPSRIQNSCIEEILKRATERWPEVKRSLTGMLSV